MPDILTNFIVSVVTSLVTTGVTLRIYFKSKKIEQHTSFQPVFKGNVIANNGTVVHMDTKQKSTK